MKILVAIMQHETNTFSNIETPLASFAQPLGYQDPPCGQAAIDFFAGTDMAIGGFLDVLKKHNIEAVVPIAAYAEPSAAVADDAFEVMAQRLCDAVANGCDGIMLDLHGAMVTQSYFDGEGELLKRIRQINPTVPIAVALDFHANISHEMCSHADIVTGYRTYPHVDMHETGLRAGNLLIRQLKGEIKPRTVWSSAPMLTHMIKQTPAKAPMKPIMDHAIELEASGQVLAASVFGGFPLADIPHAALASVIVVDENDSHGQAYADQLIKMAWAERAEFIYEPEPMEKTIAYAKTLKQGPIILADHGDNAGAGGAHDNMAVVAEILKQGLDNVAVAPIADPEAVDVLWKAGEGASITLPVGGKTATPSLALMPEPLELSGRVKALRHLKFVITGPMMTGFQVDLGRSAVFQVGSMDIIISEQRTEPADLGFFIHAGIDPLSKRYLVLKSRQHFRAGFEDIAKEILLVAGPGVCSSDYNQFPFKNLNRPIYPLDLNCNFSPTNPSLIKDAAQHVS